MTLRRSDWLFVLTVVLVVLLVSLLPSPRDRNPMIPDTPDHRSLASEKDCLRCHSIGGTRPLSDRHPKRQDYAHCHKAAKE